jgi:flagellar hook-associated protein 2
MAGIQLGGLASGMDTQAIISSLMAIERQPRVRLELRQATVQARQDALRDIATRLKALRTAAADLRSAGTWADTQKVESSDPTKVGVTRTSGAAPGTLTVDVTQLATSTQRTYDYTVPNASRNVTFSWTDGGVAKSQTVTLAAGASLDDAVGAINAGDGPAYAVNVGGKLVLTSKATGDAGAFTVSSQANLLTNGTVRDGLQAQYKIDGTQYASDTNVVADNPPGLQLTLKAIGSSSVTVGMPGADTEALVGKVKAFVDAYNAVNDAIRSRTTEKRVANPMTSTDARKGALFGDSGLVSAMASLRQAIADPVAGNPAALDQLAELGISTGATTGAASPNQDSLAGKLVFDEAKLREALAGDQIGVRRLLGGVQGVDGFAQRIDGIIDPLARGGGLFESRITAAEGDMTRLKDSITRLDSRLEQREARLRAMFTAMEQALAQQMARGAELTARLGLDRDR